MSHLDRAIKDGLAEITRRGRRQYITYHPIEHTEIYSDPEEQVRAEFWAELIYRYQYDAQRIGIEVTVPDRTPSDRADIVVFRDEERKTPYAVIECKPDGVSDAEFEQAVEQACGNGTWAKFRASYVMVVAGLTRRSLDFTEAYGVLERDKNIIADIPIRYGKPQEYKYYKGGSLDIAPVSKENLISAIRKCHQTLWGGGRLSPPTAFSELCKIIFVKISDEKKKRKKGEPYQFQIKTHEASTSLAGRIRDLYEVEQTRDPDVFTETIKVQDGTLVTVVSHLESINLSATDLDVKGLAFEQFMDGFFKGDFGQYFTPRELIDFCVRVLKPTNDDRVLDPACGSGGFLLHALDAVRNEASEYYADGSAEHYGHWHDFAKDKLFGIEINDEIARVAKMNMIIHDDGHSNVIGYDSLEKSAKIKKINRGFGDARFSLILTNPPFGAALDKAERPYLSEFDLAQQESGGKKKTRKTQRIEILFLERIWRFLLPEEGRAAIVVPDSILTNESLDYVRSWFNEHFRLLCVVSMPVGAFSVDMRHFLEEAEFALANGDVGTTVARLEAVLSTVHKLILRHAPSGTGTTKVSSRPPPVAEEISSPEQKTVLLVDDERMQLDCLKIILQGEGYQCATATSSREALQLLVETDFDLIITDLMMPDVDGLNSSMDGRELVLAAKRSGSKAKIIVLTCFSQMAVRAAAGSSQFPCDSFVSKPMLAEDLLGIIRSLLGAEHQGSGD